MLNLAKWFRAPEAKASATAQIVALQSAGRARWTPRDYAALAREGYMKNAIVHRAVRLVAENVGSVTWLLFEGEAERDAHPLLDLLARPNPRQDGAAFFESVTAHLLLAGNAYIEHVALDGRLRELHALRPDRMRVIPGADGWPEGYEYTAGGRSVRFEAEPVRDVRPILHVRLFHPANDHYGMSPIEAAATAIDIHNTASGWNKALLDNAARPSGALVLAAREGRLTGEQYERLKVMQPSSAEYTVTRTYLEWLVELPWSISTEDHIEIGMVRRVLDEDHYDLDKVKRRIVEYMAVRKLKNDKKGPILCLVGPPGVGKTSLGRSVARAIGRKFIRVSLGGPPFAARSLATSEGWIPEASSKSTTPSENTSPALVTVPPSACSGDMYRGVPRIVPASVGRSA